MPYITDKLKSFEAERPEDAAKRRPPGSVSRYTFDIPTVMSLLRRHIFGQDHVLDAVERMLKMVKAGLTDPEKPLYVGLLVGPTGVGKTELVKALAHAIHNDRSQVCRIDMNTLAQEHYASALVGAPPGYVGSKEGTSLFDRKIIEGSYSKPGIVLFDEVEKADDRVIQTLLNVFDDGMLRLASGNETIDFRNAIVLMTSNVGGKETVRLAERRFSFPLKERRMERMVMKKLANRFAPEFLNRVDETIVFGWIKEDILHRMIDKLAEQLNVRLARHSCRLRLHESAVRQLVRHGFDRRNGARALKRSFRALVEAPLAELLLTREPADSFMTYEGVGRDDGTSSIHFIEQP